MTITTILSIPPVILNKKLIGLPPTKAPKKHLTATIIIASLLPNIMIDNKVIILAKPSLIPGLAPGITMVLSSIFKTVAIAINKEIYVIRLVLNVLNPHFF